MANTQAFCSDAKLAMMTGILNLDTDTINAALFLESATRGAGDTVYNTTGEVSGTNYSPGGVAVTHATAPALDGTTAHWTPSASIVFSNVTLAVSFDAVLIYSVTATNQAISVHTFTAQTVTAGDFTLTMPTNDGTTGLVRIA